MKFTNSMMVQLTLGSTPTLTVVVLFYNPDIQKAKVKGSKFKDILYQFMGPSLKKMKNKKTMKSYFKLIAYNDYLQ